MRESGVVEDIQGDEALVRLRRHAACLGCRACSLSSGGDMIIKTAVSGTLKVGDQVTIEIDSMSIIKAIVLVYLLPAVTFLIGIFAGLRTAPLIGIYKHIEIFAVLLAVTFSSLSLFLARNYGIKKRGTYQARIIP